MQLSHAQSAKMSRNNGMKLSLEVIVASLADQTTVRYFILNEDITDWEYDPDKIVLELLDSPKCDFSAIAKKNCFVHSTSWRFEPHQTIVLTYFVYSDLFMFRKNGGKLLSLNDAVISSSDKPCVPRPMKIAEENVVSHGIRHLSHLVKSNSQNVRSILAPESIQVFMDMESHLAGRIC